MKRHPGLPQYRKPKSPIDVETLAAALGDVISHEILTSADERGRFHFTRERWFAFTQIDWSNADKPEIEFEIACERIRVTERAIIQANVTPSPRLIALAWKAGISRALGYLPIKARQRQFSLAVTARYIALRRLSARKVHS